MTLPNGWHDRANYAVTNRTEGRAAKRSIVVGCSEPRLMVEEPSASGPLQLTAPPINTSLYLSSASPPTAYTCIQPTLAIFLLVIAAFT